MRSFMICTPHQGDQIKKNGMGGACGSTGRREMHVWFWLGNLRERDHLKDLGIDRRIILKWILKDSALRN
jgi:hypothetical protein